MAGFQAAFYLAVTLVLICNVQCDDDISFLIKRIDDLNKDVIQIRKDLPQFEEKVLHQIDSTEASLRSDIKHHVHQLVREAMTDIIQSEFMEEMLKGQVITKVRQLKQENRNMKEQLDHLLRFLNNSQERAEKYLQKVKGVDNRTEDYVEVTETLKRDLEQCIQRDALNDKEIVELKQTLNALNETCQIQTSTSVETVTPTSTETPTTTETPTSTETPTPESTETLTSKPTSLQTTINPEDRRSRIIIAPIFSNVRHRFRQLNIEENTITGYPLGMDLRYVVSLAYASKQRKLLIGLRWPNRIISSSLDSDEAIAIRKGLMAHGLAVDEERELVFLTTDSPKKTISCMTTQGRNFTIISDLTYYGNYPRAIAVNSKEQKIYACNHGRVFMVTYDGSVRETLARGEYMFALTLDNTGRLLYYNDGKKLMKRFLSQNVTEEVTTLTTSPWTMRYYQNKVYFSSCCLKESLIGAVDKTRNVMEITLELMYLERTEKYAICFVP